ncbi:MAG TPA: GGDEF domain-containing protein [Candidatus Dormibacteraeota bacterium]|nr:GGDEF domain-containing protein [Candidatus Dormibacteraeota bacterium]
MRIWSQLKSLVLPGGVLLLGVVGLAYSGWFSLALPALSFLYYCALAGGALLAWRFRSSRIFFSLLVIFLAQQGVALSAGEPPFVLGTLSAVAVLVPVNFVLIALMQERGFTIESTAPVGLLLFVETLTVAVICGAGPRLRHMTATVALPRYALILLASAGVFLAVRFLVSRKPVESALLWSLCSFYLAVHFAGTPRPSTLYWATAACILAASIVENSYLLAYHDELTTLPSRRAFNDALLTLKVPYSIAVVDIDHFKRFNDTYGHDTGDQVLRLVAGKLARVTGGGEAYRCGGEEFMILFAGKTTAEVGGHLEQLRETVEASQFLMRGNDRRQAPRGPDRRNQRPRRSKKGHAIRQLAAEPASTALSVTVSIGVASSTEKSNPDTVLKAADKALYRAKENGRNRVETASSTKRIHVKAAGIA